MAPRTPISGARWGGGLLLLLAACGSESASGPSATATSTAPKIVASSAAPTQSAAPEPPPVPEQIIAQHVLIAYKGAKNTKGVSRSKADAKKLAEDVQKQAVGGADFGELAKKYSDDPASKERQGSVGKFKKDGMVKEFSDAAFALPVDGISPVVESPFGFHIIKRTQ